ncbi:hypothetical protein GIB67_006368 [Kingdonia uniflora]|uniref:Protein kinase domain-containing protein n=1 Tax=Kingdonia uniflora TaxID=39325 RepID=A0A7J7P173_9MAGN|nr:hypothetical protein GIB67_006368 [Kingdonia uniflora]
MMGGVGGGEEVVEVAEKAHLKGKEIDGSPGMLLAGRDWREGSPQVLSDSLKGKSISTGASSEPCSRSDCDDMIEELTLKKYPNPNFVVVGSSTNREAKSIRQSQWHHFYQLGGGSGNKSSHRENVTSGGSEKAMGNLVTEELSQDHVEISEHLIDSNKNPVVAKSMLSPTGIRTKLLSSSGFTQFFVKNSLNAKGVVSNRPEARNGFAAANMNRNKEKSVQITRVADASTASPNLGVKADVTLPHTVVETDPKPPNSFQDGISLMEWLKPGSHIVNKAEKLHIFRQILEVVNHAHSRQIVLNDIRPSSFKLLPPSRVKYVGFLARRELLETSAEHHFSRKRLPEESLCPCHISSFKHKRPSEIMLHSTEHSRCINSTGSQGSGYNTIQQHNSPSEYRPLNKSGLPMVSNNVQQQFTSANVQLEEKWYISPEEHDGSGSSFSSNIYCLGILLFELLCYFKSLKARAKAMLDLRHRILPPSFLSEYPREAGFCLWLLHPIPSSRPTTREILQSELICESQEFSPGDQSSLSVDEDQAESELLLHFLKSLKDQMQKQASKLVEEVGCLQADLEDVGKRHMLIAQTSSKDPLRLEAFPRATSLSNMIETRLIRNIDQLENAYFTMKSQGQLSDSSEMGRTDKDLLQNRERWLPVQKEMNQNPDDRLRMFFDGLCKYARYSTFEVRGTLRNADLLNSANVICSLSFDRDEDFFAAAGVSKKIKIFDFHNLLDDSIDIHYPVIELSSKSKLSCICWNNYIKNYLASTDYDGVVQIWDASTGQGFSQYAEHQKRAWSVDFSQLDPTNLASGSDDHSVKLWTINERKSVSTIRNVANVCCVQFSPHSANLLAFGSADYKTYCYDLRNTKNPWCTMSGHGKAVSYVKFLDPETLISASTDNTLKLWDLNKTNSSGLSVNACSLTFRGHTNEKNFVGLSVSEGYIACGSETNEVYAYHRSLPMPLTSHKFGSVDPISGQETIDDNGQFVSSVCWRGKSDVVVTANSSGSIKVLQVM